MVTFVVLLCCRRVHVASATTKCEERANKCHTCEELRYQNLKPALPANAEIIHGYDMQVMLAM